MSWNIVIISGFIAEYYKNIQTCQLNYLKILRHNAEFIKKTTTMDLIAENVAKMFGN